MQTNLNEVEYIDAIVDGVSVPELMDEFMLEIDLNIAGPEEKTIDERFLILKETLTRIGVASYKTNTLFQTCHILHKRGRYFLVHFKELFLLDGRETSLDEEDVLRRNFIAKLVIDWGLCEPIGWEFDESHDYLKQQLSHIKVLSHRDASDWDLKSKHPIGKRSSNNHRGS